LGSAEAERGGEEDELVEGTDADEEDEDDAGRAVSRARRRVLSLSTSTSNEIDSANFAAEVTTSSSTLQK